LEVVAQTGNFGLERRDFLGGHGGEVGIVGFGEFLIIGEVAFGGLEIIPELEGLFEFAVFAQQVGGSFGLGKQLRIAHRFFQF